MAEIARDSSPVIREIVSPEGVALRFVVPELSVRFAAFASDFMRLLLYYLLSVVLLIALSLFSGTVVAVVAMILVYLIPFGLLNGYFLWYESRPRGASPGKRKLGLRVIDRAGGKLTTEAILARNLVRNFEFVLPLLWIWMLGQDKTESHTAAIVFLCAFVLLCALAPFFHKDRLRVGDLIAGTMVVASPIAQLERELAKPQDAGPELSFTLAQLSIYGVYELQVLEDILRQSHRAKREKLLTIAAAIRKKIGYTGEIKDPRAFLKAFYAAQRGRLEHELALGRRKESKLG